MVGFGRHLLRGDRRRHDAGDQDDASAGDPRNPRPVTAERSVRGFLLGAAKGCLVAVFVTAGIQKYALTQIATIPWADEQAKTSLALR